LHYLPFLRHSRTILIFVNQILNYIFKDKCRFLGCDAVCLLLESTFHTTVSPPLSRLTNQRGGSKVGNN
jgi:hypothetical protein